MDKGLFEHMSKRVAEVLIEKEVGKDMVLLAEHKKAKLEEHRGRVSLPCSLCLMNFTATSQVILCSTEGCMSVWCGREKLCDKSKHTCDICQSYMCPDCVGTMRRCDGEDGCTTNACSMCRHTCKCNRYVCRKHLAQEGMCEVCLMNDFMAIDHYFSEQKERISFAAK